MDNEQIQVKNDSQQGPDYIKLLQDIKKYRKTYYKVLAITFVLMAFITLSIPNYYKCTVKLVPEASSTKGTGSLSSLASSFGFNVGGSNTGGDAIAPLLYPDLMNSVAFRASLFPIEVIRENDSTQTKMTYYDYLLNEQKLPWWSSAGGAIKDWIISLFISEEEPETINPFKLTKEQYSVVKMMEKKVVCDVEQKTLVITIDVTDTDPLIAATMADSVQRHLQEFITDYRTKKARIDLAYSQKLYDEAKDRYDEARKRSAAFNDANRHVIFDKFRSERTEFENEMQLQYRTYSQVAAQLQLAEAKVQEDTPAFTTLQPATVPVKKQGPKRAILCLATMFVAFLCTSLFVFYKEGELQPFINRLHHDPLSLVDADVEEYYVISKFPPHRKG